MFALVLVILLLVGRAAAADDSRTAAQQALDKGDIAKAREILDNALKDNKDDADLHFRAARAARIAGAPDAAEQHLKECERQKKIERGVALERKLLRAQFAELRKVEEELKKNAAERDYPEAYLVLEALSLGYVRYFRYPDAFKCLNDWLERRPDDVRALLLRAEVWDHVSHDQWKAGRGLST
jgi:Tfp pilus assembly protein PilF